MSDNNNSTAEWSHIATVMQTMYPHITPLVFRICEEVDGEDVSVFASCYATNDFWHCVTYGISTPCGGEAGEGPLGHHDFELSIRVRRCAQDDEGRPPVWCLSLLEMLVMHVAASGSSFQDGDFLHLEMPITLWHQVTDAESIGVPIESELCALAFVADRVAPLVPRDATHHVYIVQIVGVTADEFRLIQDWSAVSFCQLLSANNRLLVNDLRRTSVLNDPAVAEQIAAIRPQHGGSTYSILLSGEMNIERRNSRELELQVGEVEALDLRKCLRSRILDAKSFSCENSAKHVRVEWELDEKKVGWSEADGTLRVRLTKPAVLSLIDALGSGDLYTPAPGLSVRTVHPAASATSTRKKRKLAA